MGRAGEGPVWLLTCCGCLGPIILVKICLVVGPMLLYVLVVNLCIAFYLFFTGIPRLTWALCRRNDAGPVIKCLAFLFWMIPAALFFPAVVVGSVFLALYAAVVLPAIATDDENNHILGGFIFMFSELWDPLRDFRKEGDRMINNFVQDSKQETPPGEMPCDIPLLELFAVVFTGIMGVAVVWPWWLFIMAYKLLPFIFRMYYELIKWYGDKCDSRCGLCVGFLPFLVLCCLALAVIPFIFLVCAILGFLVGLYAGAVTFQSGRMSVAFRYMYAALYEFDRQSYKIIFETGYSYGQHTGRTCLGCCVRGCDCCQIGSDDGCMSNEVMEFVRDTVRLKQ